MNIQTAKILCSINTAFYRDHAPSFSATRTAPWPGWSTSLEGLEGVPLDGSATVSVFDLASGNLRFEAFVKHAFPQADTIFYAVDNCDALLPSAPAVRYRRLDVVSALLDGCRIDGLADAPSCDLSVSFGFLHHIPTEECRRAALSSLIGQTRAGGYVIVSLWRFLHDRSLAAKAHATHERASRELGLPELDDGDFLLGWRNVPGAYRYCHSFSDADVDRLAGSVAKDATVVRRFTSDGRTGDLNAYLVLRVR